MTYADKVCTKACINGGVIVNIKKSFELRSHLLKERINRYAILGLVLSCATIIIGSILAAYQQSNSMDIAAVIHAQKTNPG